MHYIIIVVTYLLHVPKVGEVHSAGKRAAGGNDKQGDWHGAKSTGFSIVLVSSQTRDRRLELAIAARKSANGKLKSGRSGVAIAGLGEVQGRRPDAECRGRLPTKRGRTPARARDRPTQIGTPRAWEWRRRERRRHGGVRRCRRRLHGLVVQQPAQLGR
jgi:hypothetical protein